ncbi:MAG: ABC transporter substrate-binding protein [Actinomycetales bacterium]|nr:ABC transporter substrate-binding protein [Actinomycetales bacterium]
MGTLHEVFEYPLTRLDPVRGDHVDPPSVAIFETLLRKGAGDRPMPGLAVEWAVDPDGLTWRLRLRPGARFHGGDPCDARAVAAALERCRWGDGLPRQVWYWDPVETVSVVDDRTIAIGLRYPCARLPVLLWGTHTAIANPAAWDRLGEEFGIRDADGTGPYRLIAYSPDAVTADRVDPHVGPARITWSSAPDDAERAACLQDPGVDIVRYVERADVPAGWAYAEQPEDSQFTLSLNFDDPRGFGDLQVRRCFDALIDRERIVSAALAGRGDARRSPIPLADARADDYDPGSVPAMPPEQARAVLEALGWSRGADGIRCRADQRMSIDCVIQDTSPGRAIAAEVARQLLAEGIELRLRPVPLFEPFYRAVAEGPAAFISKWLWPDAMEAIMGFSRSDCIEAGGGNWQHARCPAVDAAFDAFLQAAAGAPMAEASAAAQRAFMTHLPYLPLVSTMESIAVRERVRGFGLTPRTLYPAYENVTIADRSPIGRRSKGAQDAADG